jgi:hypothetical protein
MSLPLFEINVELSMAEERFLSVQFCDDIRQEVGNKFSLMGCYGPSMLVSAFPLLLPKLCAQVKVMTAITRPFQRLAIRVHRDDELLIEMPISSQTLASADDYPSWARFQMVNALVVMAPFQVDAPCSLRVEAETEDGCLSGGAFRIEHSAVPEIRNRSGA